MTVESDKMKGCSPFSLLKTSVHITKIACETCVFSAIRRAGRQTAYEHSTGEGKASIFHGVIGQRAQVISENGYKMIIKRAEFAVPFGSMEQAY
jgi:hypothetical protein